MLHGRPPVTVQYHPFDLLVPSSTNDLWIACTGGPFRFDGQAYHAEDGGIDQGASGAGSLANDLLEAADGTLYIAVWGQGVFDRQSDGS